MTSVFAQTVAVMTPLCDWLVAHGSSCLELFGFVTGVANVWLVTRQSTWSWPLGVLNAVVYLVVFARAGLYSDTGLQVVYFVLSLYGWWHWTRGGAANSADGVYAPAPLPVTSTSPRLAVLLAGVVLVTWVALAQITSRIPGAALPWLDALLVAVSLVAQYMMTRKLLANWLLWIAADVVYVGLFINRGLPLTAVLYTIFLALAIWGYISWRRSMPAMVSTA
ncbi:nicotinamide riboside transporter PnuC [Gemmatimonas sp.]|jgi:nicotinamide mononucleotide transporter|uniref:nicotinamide riboside transporter PnuC n=1 Tax=Gemmatimonas sp. TaxID=1962908 RepID=UPI0037BFA854